MNYIIKKHRDNDGKLLLAIIDENLKNKRIEEGEKILDLKSNFYKGELASKEEILNLINNASHLNIVGNKIVELLSNKNLVDNAMKIGGVAYAHVIILRE
jgi:hypothetical protein